MLKSKDGHGQRRTCESVASKSACLYVALPAGRVDSCAIQPRAAFRNPGKLRSLQQAQRSLRLLLTRPAQEARSVLERSHEHRSREILPP
jgi:hypothetical protein